MSQPPLKTSKYSTAKPGTPALVAKGIVKRFKTGRSYIEVLKGVDFEALHGDVTMVMGPSGSGKSTLVACLSGLLRPDEGEVTALGQKLWDLPTGKIDQFRLDYCGFIFQGFNLFPALTATEQVSTVLKYTGLDKGKARAQAIESLTEVGLGKRINQRPVELSGGEKQRVAIARALSKRPTLLFADEPTSALDGENGQIVIRLLQRAAKEHNAAVICVTHDPRLESFADRIIHIEDGRILDDRRANAAGPAPAPSLIGA
jgi:putative ABC transport system ATP-binding protein